MKKIKITTPDNIEVEYSLANIGSRMAATGIDSIIIYLTIFLLILGIMIIVSWVPEFWDEFNGWILALIVAANGIINYGYYMIAELIMNGQTPGKRLLGLRTIRSNGQPITFKLSAIRNLFKVIIDSYGVGVLMIFLTKDHKRIGDILASTMVVIEDKKQAPVTLQDLTGDKDKYSYYLSQEENDLLQEYYRRKGEMKDYSLLQQSIREYFTEKFQDEDTLDQWKEFIDKI